MANTMQCDIVSAGERIFSGPIRMLIARGVAGELGILPQHVPLITLLQPGSVRIEMPDGHEEHVYVSGGVLEVQPHIITLLADSAIRAKDLDEAKIKEARKAAELALSSQKAEMDTGAALAALAETAAQLATLQKYKNRA